MTDIINVAIGGFFILLGLLVKRFPNLIAGYNTMSKEQQKNVDVIGLSTHLRNSFILIGFLIIIEDFICRILEFNKIIHFIMPITVTLFLPYLIIKAQRYDHNKLKH
jgi:Domain of unknown function (DUF3784)